MLTSTSVPPFDTSRHSPHIDHQVCLTTLLQLFSHTRRMLHHPHLHVLYHSIMNKTRTNRVNRNIYLTPKPRKSCQAFFSCTKREHRVHLNSQLHFTQWTLFAAHSSSESPIKGNMARTIRIVRYRTRKMWKNLKKWLQYHPEKNYFRGHSD